MRDIESLLLESDPAADVQPYTEDRRREVLDRAMEGVRPRRRKGWRVAAAAAASASVLGLGAYGAYSVQWVATAPAESPTEIAIDFVDAPATADQYWKITTTGESTNASHEDGKWTVCLVAVEYIDYYSVSGDEPTWVERPPRVPVRPLSGGTCHASDDKDGDVWVEPASPNAVGGSWQRPSPNFFAELPRDVDALSKRLYADSAGTGNGRHSAAFTYAADMLRTGMVPADLRSSLYEVLKDIPRTNVGARTVNGVEGVAVSREDEEGAVDELIFDPADGHVIAEAGRSAAPDSELPELMTVIERELVDEIPQELQDRVG